MSPALNGSTALQRFERSNASEIRNGMMFDFYPGLPEIVDIWEENTALPGMGNFRKAFLVLHSCGHYTVLNIPSIK